MTDRATTEMLEETERIMRAGTIWTAAAMVAPAVGLGPLLAAGWRPSALPAPFDLLFWVGAVAAAGGLGLLMWAGCPVPAFTPERAHHQKAQSIRIGIVLNLAGTALAGLIVLLAPVAR